MCEANVYLRDGDGTPELFFENVDKLMPSGDRLILQDIFGQRRIITADISELLLGSHKIILQKRGKL